jgi:hypothetical protein
MGTAMGNMMGIHPYHLGSSGFRNGTNFRTARIRHCHHGMHIPTLTHFNGEIRNQPVPHPVTFIWWLNQQNISA